MGEAEEFIEDTGIESFTMLWDESFQSWMEIGITSQPSALLLAPNGEPIAGWVGPYPEAEVVELIQPYVG